MNAVLGGLFSSRINLNLREVHAYTYGAHSVYDWRRGAGPFVVNTAVQSDVTEGALREILLEINRIRAEPVETAGGLDDRDQIDAAGRQAAVAFELRQQPVDRGEPGGAFDLW